jgi:hypothetical protein
MHQVGFGDCFLLSFTYPQPLEDGRSERHVLIDFGTVSLPTGWKDLKKVAAEINHRTTGQIDAIVVSHRHRDHLSAFGIPDIAQQLTEQAAPKLVIRPWTEDPGADANFTGGDGPGEHSLAFVKSLRDAHDFANAMATQIATQGGRSLQGDLRQAATTQLSNQDAIAQLDAWSENGRGEYLHYGTPTTLGSLLPGVTVRVLGPPTIEQHADVASERASDPTEFWMLYRQLVGQLPTTTIQALVEAGKDQDPLSAESADKADAPDMIAPVKWLTAHLDRQQLGSFLRIVRVMDDALNNTSVILVFDVEGSGGTKRLLFPGDAQIENWEYALKLADAETNTKLLQTVDLYKVGHHGSRNATPRTLFDLWTDPKVHDRPMTGLMSTKPGVYGRSPETAVPRSTLVDALTARMSGGLFDTEKVDGLWAEVSAETSSPDPFSEFAGG